jgi:hypothetical protein
LTTAATVPVTLSIPHKVVYSVHDYPVTISCVSPDNGPTKIAGMNQTWGYLETRNIAPVWIGEMGGSLDGTDDSANLSDEQAWAATLVAYLNGQDGAQGGPTFSGNQQGVGTDWWAWGALAGQWPDGTVLPNGSLNPAQQAVYSKFQPTAVVTKCTASANNSTVTTPGPTLCDAAGDVWAITNSGTITKNGAPAGYSSNVIELAYVSGVIWQENASKLWWQYTNGGWSPNNGTPISPLPTKCTPSANDSTVTVPGQTLCDSASNVWAITSSATVAENGSPAGFSANVVELAYANGVIWQKNASNLWWEFVNGGWSPNNGTPTPPF